MPIPIERIPRHQGTDYAYIKALAHEVGYVFYIDPGPVPGMSKAYWGPEIQVGAPQPALNVDLDGPHTNVEEPLASRFDKEKKELPVVFIQEPIEQGADPDPDPGHHAAQPAARRRAAAAAEDHVPQRHREPEPARRRRCAGSRTPASTRTRCSARARSTSRATATCCKSRQLVGVRGAGEAFDGLYYVTTVTTTIKRGEYKQTFSLARNGLALDAAGGAGMSDSHPRAPRYYGKYRGTVHQQRRPDADRADPGDGARRLRRRSRPRGRCRACPVAGINTGVFTVPQIGAGVWVEFEQGDPDYPIWVGGFWGTRGRGAGALARRAAGRERHHVPDDAEERDRRQRRARARPAGS